MLNIREKLFLITGALIVSISFGTPAVHAIQQLNEIKIIHEEIATESEQTLEKAREMMEK